MNRSALQTHLDNLFSDALPRLHPPSHICWFQEQIHITPSDHTLYTHHVFFVLKSRHIRKGLTSAEWDQVTDRIFDFLKDTEPCQK